MPATSTAVNGCGWNIMMADEQGVLRDISGSSNEFSLDFSNELGEYKVFGVRAMNRLECGVDASLELTALYSRALFEAANLIKYWKELRGRRLFQISGPSNAPGNDRYTGYFLYEKINISVKADDAKPIPVKMTLKPDGDVVYMPIPG